MGRGFIVEEAVEAYLSKLCEPPSSRVTGLLIGQVQDKLPESALTHGTSVKAHALKETYNQVNIITMRPAL